MSASTAEARSSVENLLDSYTPSMFGLNAAKERNLKELTQVFKLVADETRVRILYYLCQTPELHVKALCELVNQSQPAVSHHLALLRVAGMIQCRREGKHNFYRIMPRRFRQIFTMFFEKLAGGSSLELDGGEIRFSGK